MINWIHSKVYSPLKGWDPVSLDYAEVYTKRVWSETGYHADLLRKIQNHTGSLSGRRILDLGGGPGHFTTEWAKRGGSVLWFDISHRYQKIAQTKVQESGVSADFEIGYLDDVGLRHKREFDMVFNHVCWYYCKSDRRFAQTLMNVTKPGGYIFVRTNNEKYASRRNLKKRLQYSLYHLGYKVGHPYPRSGRIQRLFESLGGQIVYSECNPPEFDEVLVRVP